MVDRNIGQLSIQITSDAKQAGTAIDHLARALSKLSPVVKSTGAGLVKTADGISDAGKGLQSLNKLNLALQKLSMLSFDNLAKVSHALQQIKANLDFSKQAQASVLSIKTLADSMTQMSKIGEIGGFTDAATKAVDSFVGTVKDNMVDAWMAGSELGRTFIQGIKDGLESSPISNIVSDVTNKLRQVASKPSLIPMNLQFFSEDAVSQVQTITESIFYSLANMVPEKGLDSLIQVATAIDEVVSSGKTLPEAGLDKTGLSILFKDATSAAEAAKVLSEQLQGTGITVDKFSQTVTQSGTKVSFALKTGFGEALKSVTKEVEVLGKTTEKQITAFEKIGGAGAVEAIKLRDSIKKVIDAAQGIATPAERFKYLENELARLSSTSSKLDAKLTRNQASFQQATSSMNELQKSIGSSIKELDGFISRAKKVGLPTDDMRAQRETLEGLRDTIKETGSLDLQSLIRSIMALNMQFQASQTVISGYKTSVETAEQINAELKKSFQGVGGSIAQALKVIGNLKTEAKELKMPEVVTSLGQIESRFKTLQSTMKHPGFQENAESLTEIQRKLAGLNTELSTATQGFSQMATEIENATSTAGASTANLGEIFSDFTAIVGSLETAISTLWTGIKMFGGGIATAAQATSWMASSFLKLHIAAGGALVSSIRLTGQGLGLIAENSTRASFAIVRIVSGFNLLTRSVQNFGRRSRAAQNFLMQLPAVLRRIIYFRMVNTLFRGMLVSIRDGMRELAMFSDQFNHSMSMMITRQAHLGRVMGTMISPVVQALIPLFIMLTNVVIRAANAIQQFFAVITGRGYWYRAVEGWEDYREAINGATAALNNFRGGFDELNVISVQDEGFGEFERMEIEEAISRWADAIRDLGRQFADWIVPIGRSIGNAFTEAWNRVGAGLLDALRRAIPNILGLIGDIGRMLRNAFDRYGADMFEAWLRAITGIINAIDAMATAWRMAWAEHGLDLLRSIMQMLTTMGNLVERIALSFERFFRSEWGPRLFGAWMQAATAFFDMIESALAALLRSWHRLGDNMVMAWGRALTAMGYAFMQFFRTIEVTLDTSIGDAFFDNILIAITNIGRIFENVFVSWMVAWDGFGQGLVDAVFEAGATIVGIVGDIARIIGNAFYVTFPDDMNWWEAMRSGRIGEGKGIGVNLFVGAQRAATELLLLIDDIGRAFRLALHLEGQTAFNSMVIAAADVLGVVESITYAFRRAWDEGYAGAVLFHTMLEIIGNVAAAIGNIGLSIQSAFRSVGDDDIEIGVGFFSGAIGLATELARIVRDITRDIGQIFISDTGVRFFTAAINLAGELLNTATRIAAAFRDAWNYKGLGRGTLDAMATAAGNVLDLAREIVSSFRIAWDEGSRGQIIFERLLGVFRDIWTTIENIAGGIAYAWRESGHGIEIMRILLGLVNNLLIVVGEVASRLRTWSESADFAPMLEALKGLLQIKVSIILGIVDAIMAVGSAIGSALGGRVTNILGNILTVINNIVNAFVNWAQKTTIFNTLAGYLENFTRWLSESENAVNLLKVAMVTLMAVKFGGWIAGLVKPFANLLANIKILTGAGGLAGLKAAMAQFTPALGIIGVLTALVIYSEDFRTTILELLVTIGRLVASLAGPLLSAVGTMARVVGDFLALALRPIIWTIERLADLLQGPLGTALTVVAGLFIGLKVAVIALKGVKIILTTVTASLVAAKKLFGGVGLVANLQFLIGVLIGLAKKKRLLIALTNVLKSKSALGGLAHAILGVKNAAQGLATAVGDKSGIKAAFAGLLKMPVVGKIALVTGGVVALTAALVRGVSSFVNWLRGPSEAQRTIEVLNRGLEQSAKRFGKLQEDIENNRRVFYASREEISRFYGRLEASVGQVERLGSQLSLSARDATAFRQSLDRMNAGFAESRTRVADVAYNINKINWNVDGLTGVRQNLQGAISVFASVADAFADIDEATINTLNNLGLLEGAMEAYAGTARAIEEIADMARRHGYAMSEMASAQAEFDQATIISEYSFGRLSDAFSGSDYELRELIKRFNETGDATVFLGTSLNGLSMEEAQGFLNQFNNANELTGIFQGTIDDLREEMLELGYSIEEAELAIKGWMPQLEEIARAIRENEYALERWGFSLDEFADVYEVAHARMAEVSQWFSNQLGNAYSEVRSDFEITADNARYYVNRMTDDILSALDRQIESVINLSDNTSRAFTLGMTQPMLDALDEMPGGAAAALERLNLKTDDELAEFFRTWEGGMNRLAVEGQLATQSAILAQEGVALESISKMNDKIRYAIVNDPGFATEFAENAGSAVSGMIAVFQSAENIDAATLSAKDLMGAFSTGIGVGADELKGGMTEAGLEFMGALSYGMNIGTARAKEALEQAGDGMGGAILAGLHRKMMIGSPSKVMVDEGYNIGNSIVIGAEMALGVTKEVGSKLGDNLVDGFGGAVPHVSNALDDITHDFEAFQKGAEGAFITLAGTVKDGFKPIPSFYTNDITTPMRHETERLAESMSQSFRKADSAVSALGVTARATGDRVREMGTAFPTVGKVESLGRAATNTSRNLVKMGDAAVQTGKDVREMGTAFPTVGKVESLGDETYKTSFQLAGLGDVSLRLADRINDLGIATDRFGAQLDSLKVIEREYLELLERHNTVVGDNVDGLSGYEDALESLRSSMKVHNDIIGKQIEIYKQLEVAKNEAFSNMGNIADRYARQFGNAFNGVLRETDDFRADLISQMEAISKELYELGDSYEDAINRGVKQSTLAELQATLDATSTFGDSLLASILGGARDIEQHGENIAWMIESGVNESVLDKLRDLPGGGAEEIARLRKEIEAGMLDPGFIQQLNDAGKQWASAPLMATAKEILAGTGATIDEIKKFIDECGKAFGSDTTLMDVFREGGANAVKELLWQISGAETIAEAHAASEALMEALFDSIKSEELTGYASEVGEEIVSAVLSEVGGMQAIANATTSGRTLANATVDGITNGITSKRSELISVGSSISDWIIDSAFEAAQVSSPSRITIELGENIGMGVPIGIRNTIAYAVSTAEEFINAVTDAIYNTYTKYIGELPNFTTQVFSGMYDGAKNTFSGIADWINSRVVQRIESQFNSLQRNVVSAMRAAQRGVQSTWNAVSEWFRDRVTEPIHNYFEQLKRNIVDLMTRARNEVQRIWDIMPGWFNTRIIIPIRGHFENLGRSIVSSMTNASHSVQSTFQWMASTITIIINDLMWQLQNLLIKIQTVASAMSIAGMSHMQMTLDAPVSGFALEERVEVATIASYETPPTFASRMAVMSSERDDDSQGRSPGSSTSEEILSVLKAMLRTLEGIEDAGEDGNDLTETGLTLLQGILNKPAPGHMSDREVAAANQRGLEKRGYNIYGAGALELGLH